MYSQNWQSYLGGSFGRTMITPHDNQPNLQSHVCGLFPRTMERSNNPSQMTHHMAVRLQDNIVVIRTTHPRNIWVYNLYTEHWRKYRACTRKAPDWKTFIDVSGFAIGQGIYVVAPQNHHMASLWKLTRSRGSFSWSDIVINRAPSFRKNSACWEYGEKLWMFGGYGPNPAEVGYVNEYVDFKHTHWVRYITYGLNNQLICFDPSCQEWTSHKCSGNVPSPQCHSSAIIGDEAYVYAKIEDQIWLNDFHKLDMRNLTWTEIRTVPQIPQPLIGPSLNAITGNQLVFHGIQKLTGHSGFAETKWISKITTWILDVDSMSFREYKATMDDDRHKHRSVRGLNSCVMLIGGSKLYAPNTNITSSYGIRLEPKSLQEVAMKMIYENQEALPYKQLPMKLIQKIMGTSAEENTDTMPMKLPGLLYF